MARWDSRVRGKRRITTKAKVANTMSGFDMIKRSGGMAIPATSLLGKFALECDDRGFAAGISIGGFWVTHFDRGTTRNEEYAQWIVDRLNGSGAEMPNVAEATEIRRRREDDETEPFDTDW